MRKPLVLLFVLLNALLWTQASFGQIIDCNCLSSLPVLRTNACSGVVPDLCAWGMSSNCISAAVPPGGCSQNPPAGTVVGPGTTLITVLIIANGQVAQCVVPFTVTPLPTCVFSLICSSNKTVECGSAWVFDPPAWTNACVPANGTPPNVTLTNISLVTNGTCPEVITATWQGVDDCGAVAYCSQTVTVQDTTPPTIVCQCIQSSPALTTNACYGIVPDLCVYNSCFSDNCGPLKCFQNPAAGTVLPPGVHPITVSATDCAGNSNGCIVNFTITALPNCGGFTLVCNPATQIVECGTPWTLTPPAVVNFCQPSNVSLTVSYATSGVCPQTITATWVAYDLSCAPNQATCSQTVNIQDTTAPIVNCQCLRDQAHNLLITNACSGIVPSLCQFTQCLLDKCGVVKCSQSPPPGTIVAPGVHPITVTITDCAGNTASCAVPFKVIASLQTNIWNTGMGGSSGNIPLAPGTPDPNYNLVSMPPGSCPGPAQVINPTSLPGVWVPNGPNSQWIGGGPGAACQPGVYQYRLCFYLSCTDGAAVRGQWTGDDFGEILLNGQPTGYTLPSTQYPWSFTGWNPIEITNGFVCGYNCMDFYVTNWWTVDNPTGFRAELTNTFNECCCSPTQALFSVNSGVGPNGPLQVGQQDPNIALTCAPQGVQLTSFVIPPNGIWLPNGPNSQWIGPSPSPVGGNPGGVYCYTFNFSIPCPSNVPIKAVVSGQWSADDTGTIYLNGNPTGNTLPNGWAFTNWQSINLTSGFVPGLNTLTFYVTNGGPSTTYSDTGLRLELCLVLRLHQHELSRLHQVSSEHERFRLRGHGRCHGVLPIAHGFEQLWTHQQPGMHAAQRVVLPARQHHSELHRHGFVRQFGFVQLHRDRKPDANSLYRDLSAGECKRKRHRVSAGDAGSYRAYNDRDELSDPMLDHEHAKLSGGNRAHTG
jgi:hypothetical protein